jgi:hypothetical protein
MPFWDSLKVISLLNTGAQWLVVIAGVAALVFGACESALKERAQGPRSISAKQRAAFLAAAAGQRKGRVTVIPIMANVESERYGKQLAGMLMAAGYAVEMSGMLPMDATTPTGLGLTVRKGETYPPYADGLEAALNAAGVLVGRGHNGMQNANALGLVVGAKADGFASTPP